MTRRVLPAQIARPSRGIAMRLQSIANELGTDPRACCDLHAEGYEIEFPIMYSFRPR
jgi:hypothetical protein